MHTFSTLSLKVSFRETKVTLPILKHTRPVSPVLAKLHSPSQTSGCTRLYYDA